MKSQNIARKAYLILAFILIISCILFPAHSEEKSLYERLGGVNAIASVVDDFIDKLLSDPAIVANKNVVVSLKNITVPGLKYLLTEMVCEASGGPQKYTGRPMKESHAHLNITESEWQAMEADFLSSLKKFNVPEKEQGELVAIVRSTKKDIVAAKETPPPAPAEAQKAAPEAPKPQAPAAVPEAQKAAPPEAPVAPPQPPPAPQQADNEDDEEEDEDEDMGDEEIDPEIFDDEEADE